MDLGANTTILPVGLVCTYVKQIFDAEEMLHGVTVLGEVSNLKSVNGYVYFNLKDDDGMLNCACFGLSRGELPRDGDKVYVNGSLSFYQKGGKLSFIVSKIFYAGLGDIMLKYLQVKNALCDEGLFDERYKKPIPKYPKKICVVTSKTGAVIRDVVRTIRNKNSFCDIIVVDVRVQGEGAPSEIVKGLKTADMTNSDVIILARGGGSWEDLVPFCDESVARAVFETNTPIITAIGHETDTTLVDYVSDMRASTPTGAAEYLAFSTDDVKYAILDNVEFINRNIDKKLSDAIKMLRTNVSYVSAKAESLYERANARINGGLVNIYSLSNSAYKDKVGILACLMERVNALSPMQNLKKGLYKVAVDGVTAVTDTAFEIGKTLTIDSSTAEIDAKIIEIRRKGV